MPVGSPSTEKTLTTSIFPCERRSSATPSSDFGPAVVSETKSQQPSGDETVLNGWPGNCTKETGDAGASLHRVGAAARVWPCAAEAKTIVSAHAHASVTAVFILRMRRIIF